MNLKNQITLRQLISFVKKDDDTQPRNKKWMLKRLYKYLWDMHQYPFDKKNPSLTKITRQYEDVITELLSKKKVKSNAMPIVARSMKPDDDRIEIALLNLKYEVPKRGLKPWGGKNPPKGYYNCNSYKHNKYFGFGKSSWSKLIDTPIIDETMSLQPWELLGEILWELTFDGNTEKQCDKNFEILKEKLSKAIKEIKRGECVELPNKNNKEFKVVIAKSVFDCLNKIEN